MNLSKRASSRFAILVAAALVPLSLYASERKAVFRLVSNRFIQTWLVCGPFPNRGGASINTDFLAQAGGEASIRPRLGLRHPSPSVPSGWVEWQLVEANPNGRLDFKKYLHPNLQNVAYAAVYVQSEVARPALLKLGSNDRLKVWLNGELVHTYLQPRASGPDVDIVPVELKAGENLLLAKVDNTGGSWWLYARFETLESVDGKLFVTPPQLDPTPRRNLQGQIVNTLSLIVYNMSSTAAGPLSARVKTAGQTRTQLLAQSVAPHSTAWLQVALPGEQTRAVQAVKADVTLFTPVGRRRFHLHQKRTVLPEGVVYFVQGFHVDPVWRDSQSGYQVTSFANVRQYLRAVQSDPDFEVHLHEIPYLKPYYDFAPHDRALLRQLVRQGRVATSGSYNQPNETTVSGEALVRNILYGRLFHENVLGDHPTVYTPWDVFGHVIQLPQILAKSEFVGTTWERGNYRSPFVRVPDVPDLYLALAPDGTTLFTRKVRYGYDMGPEGNFAAADRQLRRELANDMRDQQTQIPGIRYDFRLNATDEKPPTPWMVGRSSIFRTYIPEVRIEAQGARDYFDSVRVQLQRDRLDIPVVSRDVSQYNEGCELSRFDLKLGNRLAENALVTAEKFATIANLLGWPYPDEQLDKGWRQVLFGQHHDGVTGCGADEPYLDLVAGYHEAIDLAAGAVQKATHFLANRISTHRDRALSSLVVFNALNWSRSDVVHARLRFARPLHGFAVVDEQGNPIPCVLESAGQTAGNALQSARVTFWADNVPALGYRTFWLVSADTLPPLARARRLETRTIENAYFRLTVADSLGGGIVSLVDKRTGREYVNTANGHPANELILLKEGPGFEPAWRFITTGEKHFSKDEPCDIQVFENPLFSEVVVTGKMPRLEKRVQTIRLYRNSPRIEFRTVLVKYKGMDGYNLPERANDEHARDRDFFCVGFPTKLPGSVPVLEDRFATKTYFPSKGYLDYRSDATRWLSHHSMNSCYQWIDASYSVKIDFGHAGSVALGPTEILTPHNRALRQAAFRLEKALAQRGVTATPSFDSVRRDYDIQYRRFSFSIGAQGENQTNQRILSALPTNQKRRFEARLQRDGYAYLFTTLRNLPGAWFNLPVLMVVGRDKEETVRAVDALVEQLERKGSLQFPSEVVAVDSLPGVPDAGLAVLNRGNIAVSTENEGTIVLGLMHTVPWQSPLLNWTHDFPERKTHVFEYALLPHRGNWRQAGLVRQGYAFNNPLLAVQTSLHSGDLPTEQSFLEVQPEDVVVTALKPRAAGNAAFRASTPTSARDGVILRFYETHGQPTEVRVTSQFPIRGAERVNLMERAARTVEHDRHSLTLKIGPNAIETLKLELAAPQPESPAPRARPEMPPVYVRYWEHNEGAAPLGYLPVNVRILGKLRPEPLPGERVTMQRLTVAVTNDYVDRAVSGQLVLTAPPGLRPVPDTLAFTVPPDSEVFYPVAIVQDRKTGRPGFIRATIHVNGRRYFDVLEVNLPEKAFGHAAETAPKGLRLDWQVEHNGDSILVHLTNPFDQPVDGTVTLIGPAESWGLAPFNPAALLAVSPWRQTFCVPARGRQTLVFRLVWGDLLPRTDVSTWLVAKLAYFGYLDYKQALGRLAPWR